MVTKKTDKSNLENKKFLFFEVGMGVAIALALCAFEWSAKKEVVDISWNTPIDNFIEEWEVDVTRPELKKEIIKPELPKIVIKPDNVEIEEPVFTFISDPEDWVFTIPEPPVELPEVDTIHRFVEKMPRYHKGGLENFHKHIQQIVKYPELAISLGLDGKVFVQFVVDKKGYVTNIEIQQGIHPVLDNAVMEAINKSDRWEPGEQMGIPVKVAMTMPVSFKLQ